MKTKFSELTEDEIKDLTFMPAFKASKAIPQTDQVQDYGIDLINAANVWKITKGNGIKVAILDTGIDADHDDLKDGIADVHDFTGSGDCTKTCEHGTHVAGIIGARDNDKGIVGVAPECEMYIGKIIDYFGSARKMAEAIDYAVDVWDVDIINISAGTVDSQPILHKAIKNAEEKGKMVICAAGNMGKIGSVEYPGKYSQTLAIGAIDSSLNLSSSSSKGCEVDFVAPGYDVLSTYPNNAYCRMSGTSMAAPFASGLAALILAKHRYFPGSKTPVRNIHDLKEHIRRVAIDLGPSGFDKMYGNGLIRIL